MDCPRGLVTYEGCRGDLYGVCVLNKCVFLTLLQEFCLVLLVYVVLFDTSGVHNRGGLRIVRGCNLENDFGASGWIRSATEVGVCILH